MTLQAVAERDEKFLQALPEDKRQLFIDARAGKPVNADLKATFEISKTLPSPDELLGTGTRIFYSPTRKGNSESYCRSIETYRH
jgi:hypothetical protein